MNPQGATLAEVQAAFAGLPRMTAEQAQSLRDDIAELHTDTALVRRLTSLAGDLRRGRDPREVSAELMSVAEEL